MKKILVTGLCLSRNLGGPAMALTLSEQLHHRYPGIDIVFAVSPLDWEEEQKWAGYYDVKVCRRTMMMETIRHNPLVQGVKNLLQRPTGLDTVPWTLVEEEFVEAMRSCDAVVCMEGISYVGDGAWDWRAAVNNYTYFHYARRLGKPYCRFIQSFGPFDDRIVRWIARRELRHLPFIMARGRHAAESCRRLVPDAEVNNFPDIAILLPVAPASWGETYLSGHGLMAGQYTVLAPSAVIANTVDRHRGKEHSAEYVECMRLIAERLLMGGEPVLLLPHMYSPHSIECDREVARLIRAGLPAGAPVQIVEDDLDVFQAKYLLAHARQCVVSRYHALVGAISTCVPAVALGWNVKYRDFMEFYNLGEMVLDARHLAPADGAKQTLDLLSHYTPEGISGMQSAHEDNAKLVLKAFERLFQWMDHGL
ncbi:MAG: polysaccharide pyruvyl transferase family protein [Lentisphaerota bacterium]